MDCCGHEGPGGGDAKFEIHKVADGVWAAVAAPAYKVNCNTAIIENADGVMIVDTHSKPSAARVISRSCWTTTRAAEGFEWESTMRTPSPVSMMAVLQFTL